MKGFKPKPETKTEQKKQPFAEPRFMLPPGPETLPDPFPHNLSPQYKIPKTYF